MEDARSRSRLWSIKLSGMSSDIAKYIDLMGLSYVYACWEEPYMRLFLGFVLSHNGSDIGDMFPTAVEYYPVSTFEVYEYDEFRRMNSAVEYGCCSILSRLLPGQRTCMRNYFRSGDNWRCPHPYLGLETPDDQI